MPSPKDGTAGTADTPAEPDIALDATDSKSGDPTSASANPQPLPDKFTPTSTKVKTGLGDDVDKAIEKCPKFAQNLNNLQSKGWSFQYGAAGKGSYCDRDSKQIIIDEDEKGNTSAVLETMAHESGHAGYTPDPYVSPKGLSKQEFGSANANRGLKDEGEATLTNVEMKRCLKKNGGLDIGVAGTQSAAYEKVADEYPEAKDRDTARQKIGDIFADKEHPSTDPSKTYRQYYEKPYLDQYDDLKGQ